MSRGLRLQDLAFLGRVGNAGVTPLSFPGLLRWYSADSYVGTDGDSVGGGTNILGPWTDLTGSGDNATNTINGPIYKTNIVGTKPVLRFATATGAFMTFAPGALAADFTVVCVCRHVTGLDGFIFYNNVSAHQLRAYFGGSHDVVYYAGGAVVSGFFGAAAVFEVVGCKRSAGTVFLRQNKTGITSGAEATAWTVVQIGNSAIGSNMDIGEILLYNTAISDTDLDLLYDQYLKPKWVSLP